MVKTDSAQSFTKSVEVKNSYRVDVNPTVAALVYFSVIYKLDLEALLLLYHKLGEEVYLMFYLFREKEISLPKISKMQRIFESATRMSEALRDQEEPKISTVQEKQVFEELQAMIDPETGALHLPLEIPYVISTSDSRVSLQDSVSIDEGIIGGNECDSFSEDGLSDEDSRSFTGDSLQIIREDDLTSA